jgi:hypothetical protein
MARQRARPKSDPDLKKTLETALGEELAVPAINKLNLFTTIGAFSFQRQDSFTTSQSIVVFIPKSCSPAALLDVDGFAATGSDGKAVFRLSRFVCLSAATIGQPLNIVATPQSTAPVYLTAQHVLVDNAADVEFTVFSWAPDGSPAPNVFFDWRSRVSFFDIVL